MKNSQAYKWAKQPWNSNYPDEKRFAFYNHENYEDNNFGGVIKFEDGSKVKYSMRLNKFTVITVN